jgi:hypothetical protein
LSLPLAATSSYNNVNDAAADADEEYAGNNAGNNAGAEATKARNSPWSLVPWKGEMSLFDRAEAGLGAPSLSVLS